MATPDASPDVEPAAEIATELGGSRGAFHVGRWIAHRALSTPPGRARWLALAWLVAIFLLSELPGRPGVGSPLWSFAFNLGHAFLYGGLALWTLLGMPRASHAILSRSSRRAVIAAAGLCGLLDEFHQRFVPGRDFSMLDLVTDLVGATIVIVVLERLVRAEQEDRRAGLWGTCLVAILAAAAASAAATFLPGFLPRYDWL